MTRQSNQRDVEPASSLNERLGLSFSNFSLLTAALTHRSYANEHQDGTEDNERLEYLGDAVLDFIVAEWSYRRFPELSEGDLTRIRAHLVRNDHLAGFARQIGLGGALRFGRGEKSSGGHQRDSLLGSAFEALLGAIFLDSNYEKARNFILPMLESARETVLDELNDPKSQLQIQSQAMKQGSPRYRLVNATGPDHAKTYEVEVEVNGVILGRGSGSSKAIAEREAAREALKKL